MTRKRKAVLTAMIVGAPIGFTAIAIALGSGADSNAPSASGSTAERVPERVLMVSRDGMPPPSRAGAPLHALRLSGPLPERATSGTVLTDEQCAPDARGVSRCLNEIRLGGGQVLRVRHPHRMMDVACLSPGERVTVRAA